ncbi:MAG: leucine-rich repeat protein [Alphaproteobacteria bacterium]|nr:leucine-rich repeat protein [Alphaproteobacteria bacterium]
MKKIMLMLGIVICLANKTHAETWNCGPATDGVYSDSVQCTYDETSKTLTISGEGEMGNYDYLNNHKSTAPWAKKDIEYAIIENGITTIGDRVFEGLFNLKEVKGTENIISVGYAAFAYSSSLTGLNFPNAQNVGGVAFLDIRNLEYVELPEGVIFGNDRDIGSHRQVFGGTKIPYCDKTGECANCGNKQVQNGIGCVDACLSGYTSYYGYCLRTRYTLPEAEAATSDDFENMIEWIFE